MKTALKFLAGIVAFIFVIVIAAFLYFYWLVCSHPTHWGGC